jgi:hypothetical protein
MRVLAIGLLLLAAWSSHAAQLYRCKTGQGGEYWSAASCQGTGGYMVDAVTVPDGLPLKEQTRHADKVYKAKQTQASSDDTARDRARTCAAIDNELAAIWSRYSSQQYNQADQVGKDQTRTRELKSQRSRLKCETR